MSDKVFTIIQITYTIVLPVVMTYIVKLVQSHENNTDNSRKADCLLLRLALIDIHDRAVRDGYINQNNFTEFEDIWKLYHEGYKGNTLTDRFHDEVKQLPIR